MRRALAIACLLVSALAGAQELEPRAYAPNPVGANFAVASYGHFSGEVMFDAALPFDDVHAGINLVALGYGRTFGVLGRGATFLFALPHAWGDMSGNIGEERRTLARAGLADARMKFSVNLIGGEALTPAEFAARTPGAVFGVSLSVVAPTGEYFPDKLINIGANRWAFKPEAGVSWTVGRWFFDGSAGVWLFTDNDDFYGGVRREQDPLTTLQAHAGYTFRPRMWLALDATYYEGGRTTVDGVHKADLQANARIGLTLAYPVTPRQSLKVTLSDGARTRIGGDFTSVALTWQYTWFDGG